MVKNNSSKVLIDYLNKLNDDNKQYVLAISQALLFSQKVEQSKSLNNIKSFKTIEK